MRVNADRKLLFGWIVLMNCAVLWDIRQKYTLLHKNIDIISIYAYSQNRITLLSFPRNKPKYNHNLIYHQLQTTQLRSRKTESTFSITKIKFLSLFLSILAYRSLSLPPVHYSPSLHRDRLTCRERQFAVSVCAWSALLKIASPLLSCLISSSY